MMDPTINVNWVPGITLEEMEKQCILSAYRFYRQNKTQTANALGIAIRTLDARLEKYEATGETAKQQNDDERARRAKILNRMRGFHEDTPNELNGISSVPRNDIQPFIENRAQPSMSMSERQEIQEVLPTRAGTNGKHRRR